MTPHAHLRRFAAVLLLAALLCMPVVGWSQADAGSGATPDAGTSTDAGESSKAGKTTGNPADKRPEKATDNPDKNPDDNPKPPGTAAIATWELQQRDLETVQGADGILKALVELAEQFEKAVRPWNGRLERATTVAKTLRQQLKNPSIPESAHDALRGQIALMEARRRMAKAAGGGYAELMGRLQQDIARVKALKVALETAAAQKARQDVEEQQRLEKARAAEKKALQELREAQEAERRERDKQIRRLIQERQNLLGKLAEVARQQSEVIQRLGSERSEVAEAFAGREREIEETLAGFPDEPSRKYAASNIDPFFDNLLRERRETRERFGEAMANLREAEEERKEASRLLDNERQELGQLQARREQLGDTEIFKQRLDLAETRVRYYRRRLEKTNDVLSARRKLLELLDNKIDAYSRAIERVLPKITEDRRDAYFSPWDHQNWENAEATLEERLRAMRGRFDTRVHQVQNFSTFFYSPSVWGWFFGFMWRLLLVPLGIYVLQGYSSQLIRRLIDPLLKRGFFRRHAAVTIKFGEWLRSIIWPVVLYILVRVVLAYIGRAFPETQILHWLAEILAIYWVVMATAKVLFLPRSYRERQGRLTPSPDLGRLSERRGALSNDVVDVFRLDVAKGEKLVRTCRHVLLFGLLTTFLPAGFAEVFGHTVVWWIVETALDWGLLVVVYLELSVWRDEIADLFDRLTGERLQGAADFVTRHKDGIFGVLFIALASVYVLVLEIIQFGRNYIVDTELSRRLANFVFRKRIEMKQRDRDEVSEAEVTETRPSDLPEDYREHFRDTPLFDEPYLIERSGLLEQVFKHWNRWLEQPRRGTLSLHGERGLGKTTLLNQVYRRLNESSEMPVVYADILGKITQEDTLGSFLAEIFDLDEVPEGRDGLLEAIRQAEPTVVMLDDCHHLFFRKIGGFRALGVFLDIVSLTDHRHYWIMTFNRFGWRYLQRVQDRKHFFGETLHLEPWSPDEIQSLIQRRNERTPLKISFTDLVVTREDEEDRANFYEVVKTANGYFRLMQEFCGGNPRIALSHWVRNVRHETDGTLQVSLFEQPAPEAIRGVSDDHLFVLTAIAQHGALSASEAADIINAEPGFCEMALNYFEESDVVQWVPGMQRYQLTAFYFRPVINRLTNSNFLWT